MTAFIVQSPIADITESPNRMVTAARGPLESQLVFGEGFILDRAEGEWVYGRAAHDGYAGYVRAGLLLAAEDVPPATHIVRVPRSDLYYGDKMKSTRAGHLSFGSRITITQTGDSFSQLHDGRWIFNKHIMPADSIIEPVADNIMAIATTFLGTPYYWGGRSGFGVDCSGLVQIILSQCGIDLPRDCCDQENVVGTAVDVPARGDLVYFKGHVGIMMDAQNIIHATAHTMNVTIEPLSDVAARANGVTAIRRL